MFFKISSTWQDIVRQNRDWSNDLFSSFNLASAVFNTNPISDVWESFLKSNVSSIKSIQMHIFKHFATRKNRLVINCNVEHYGKRGFMIYDSNCYFTYKARCIWSCWDVYEHLWQRNMILICPSCLIYVYTCM